MNIKPSLIDFRTVFAYDANLGVLIRLSTNRPVSVKYLPNSYGYVKHAGKEYPVHRVIWAVVHGEWPKVPVVHIDGNRRNNRIENLRLATLQETRPGLGIERLPNGRYRVRLFVGVFNTFDEALVARDKALAVLTTINQINKA